MKAIYMVDVPKIGDCDSCPLYDIEDVINGTRMVCLADKEEGEVCPLRPLPKKRDTRIFWFESEDTDYRSVGFNECLAEITGETE